MRGLRRVQRADALRTVGLVRQKLIRSTFSLSRSISTLPVACAASTWKITPFSRQISPISAIGWITPISLFRTSPKPRWCPGGSPPSHLEVDQAVLLNVQIGPLEALALEFAHRVEHGLVLGLHRDDVLALARL